MDLYVVAGAFALATHIAVMVIMIDSLEVNATIASGVGFLVAILIHLSIQRYILFRSSGIVARQFVGCVFFIFILAAFNIILFAANWPILQPRYVTVQLFVTATIFVANFLISKQITFAPDD